MKNNENTELIVLEEISYMVTIDEIKRDIEIYKDIKAIDPEADNAGKLYQDANKARMIFVKHRTGIEKDRKRLKATALEYGRTVDSIAKELSALASPTEHKLAMIVKEVDEHEQKKQDEAIRIEMERTNLIDKNIEDMRMLPLDFLNESSSNIQEALGSLKVPTVELFEEKIEYATEIYNISKSQLESAWENKKIVENQAMIQAKKDEEARLLKIEEDKALDIEREALKREREELNAEKAKIAQATTQAEETERLKLVVIQEEADRVADEEQRKEVERQSKIAQDEQNESRENRKVEAIDDLTVILKGIEVKQEHTTAYEIINAIVDGKIRNVRFE